MSQDSVGVVPNASQSEALHIWTDGYDYVIAESLDDVLEIMEEECGGVSNPDDWSLWPDGKPLTLRFSCGDYFYGEEWWTSTRTPSDWINRNGRGWLSGEW